VTLTCTTSPTQTDDLDPKCSGSLLGRHLNRILKSGVESTGAIVIAVVSGILLLAAVGFLFFLHRQGKLEQYL
jgi:tetrahydromethanopterin S-methyltransferase subunit F